MPGRRAERLAEQVREELSLIIGGEVDDPRVESVTVTAAKLSADLRTAKIYVSILGTEDEIKGAIDALKHARGFIRYQLGIVLRMKHTPELFFVYDDADVRAARIEELLSKELAEAKERESEELRIADCKLRNSEAAES